MVRLRAVFQTELSVAEFTHHGGEFAFFAPSTVLVVGARVCGGQVGRVDGRTFGVGGCGCGATVVVGKVVEFAEVKMAVGTGYGKEVQLGTCVEGTIVAKFWKLHLVLLCGCCCCFVLFLFNYLNRRWGRKYLNVGLIILKETRIFPSQILNFLVMFPVNRGCIISTDSPFHSSSFFRLIFHLFKPPFPTHLKMI